MKAVPCQPANSDLPEGTSVSLWVLGHLCESPGDNGGDSD